MWEKYFALFQNNKKMQKVKVAVVPIITGTFGILRKRLEEIEFELINKITDGAIEASPKWCGS